MAVKTYKQRYVSSYAYHDPETGETDTLTFVANGYLFPLFKSYTGMELSDALDEYKKQVTMLITPENKDVIKELATADSKAEQERVALDNKDVMIDFAVNGFKIATLENGMNLFEALAICMRAAALPEDDRMEGLAAGIDLLPQAVYDDIDFTMKLLQMAFDYQSYSKKKSLHSNTPTTLN